MVLDVFILFFALPFLLLLQLLSFDALWQCTKKKKKSVLT